MTRLVLVAGALACIAAPGQGGGQQKQEGPLSARIEVDALAEAFRVRLYLKNTSDKEVSVVYGHGNGGKTVVPRIHVGDYTVTPPTYTRPASRAMRPNALKVPAGQEVLYGTFVMGYPPTDRPPKVTEVRAYISFRELKLNLETPPQKLTIPGLKELERVGRLDGVTE